MCIFKAPLARTFLVALLGILFGSTAPSEGRAQGTGEKTPEGSAVYEARCASCHGSDGRADTGVGRALGIASFDGRRFTVEGVRKLLRESKSHGNIDRAAIGDDLEALVEVLNVLAGAYES